MLGSFRRRGWLPLCENCNRLQDNYERDVTFAIKNSQGGEISSTIARAKFDTGVQHYNLLSKEFFDSVHEGNLGNFEDSNEPVEEHPATLEGVLTERDGLFGRPIKKRSLWRSCKLRFHRLYRKPTERRPSPNLVTVDGRPIELVGILRNACWRGINLDPSISGQMITFPGKFIRNPDHTEFLVIENLAWDVVFGLRTINHLQHIPSFGCVPAAGALVKAPEDTGDGKKYEKEKTEQAKIIEDQKQKKREAARREETTTANATSKSK